MRCNAVSYVFILFLAIFSVRSGLSGTDSVKFEGAYEKISKNWCTDSTLLVQAPKIILQRLSDCIRSPIEFSESIYDISRQYNAYLDRSLTLDFSRPQYFGISLLPQICDFAK